jgi:tripartite ATP-independent transporter DctM subunit
MQGFDLSVFLVAAIIIATGGAPIFAVIGMITIGLFISVSQPLASIPLSQYAMTVNPSLPALPLYTLAGLLFAKSTAARRLSELISFIFGGGWRASVAASAVLCSAFTALTGGSGVTLLALGGILLPMLRSRGYPEQRGIGLITSASALGVLLAPSVPLIMYAILARVPIQTMLLAGLLPALLMVLCLLWIGGFMRHSVVEVARAELLWENADTSPPQITRARADDSTAASVPVARAASRWRQALWELMAAPVALVPLISGWATPTESAALTAFYALIVVSVIRRELSWTALWSCFLLTAQLIGGVMLILGMALGLTNFLVDAGIPDQAIDWVQSYIQSPQAFLLAAVCFIALAGALMEIYAALVVLVPLMLPLAMSYGIHPVHFGIVFLATLEMGFLCPPAGMNLYFASAVFRKPLRIVMTSILPALLAIFVGSALIALMPEIALTLPKAFNQL